MQYESGILECFLILFWSLANDNPIFVAFNELIDVQIIQFTILQTSISKKMSILQIEFFIFGSSCTKFNLPAFYLLSKKTFAS